MDDPGQKPTISPKLKAFYLVFTFLYFAIIPLKIAVMSIHDWYKQGKDETKWEGSLFEIYNSGGLYKEESYAWLSNHYCEISGNYSSNASSTFTNLYGGGVTFVVFSCLEMIFVLVFAVFGIASTCRKNSCFLCLRVLFSVLAPLAGLLAFALMAGTAVITYSDACDSTSSYLSSQTSTCALTGPQFDLFNFLYIVALSISFWICLCILNCEESKSVESISSQPHEGENHHQDQEQDQLTTRTFPLTVIGPPQNEEGIVVGIPYKDV
ncbi:unnamed protein product [Blepharisma stoltei]|uniref:Uncharacterized protein n=1 Tax=Blepharisma stoltei TaxID=1481888 RepID=A0AAU9JML2_9CILI|nr:unnamed protein product [Blepharisma stoltei]